ncbi:MAG: DUF1501 domain-containing protein [Pseudomonadota bacterium]
MSKTLSRRRLLTRIGILGCSAAASPLMTPISFAATRSDARVVVIILRGAMDGLDVVRPYGDREFAAVRPGGRDGIELDGFYALHPDLGPLHPLWQSGELAFAHAVSTPYRDRRSHFDGQDLLEAGTADMSRDGWLNRALAHLPGAVAETAYAIGREDMRVLQGATPFASWAPDADLTVSQATLDLVQLVSREDPLFTAAVRDAIRLSKIETVAAQVAQNEELDMGMAEPPRGPANAHLGVAQFAAQKLRADARIAAFSLGGWDTHAVQDRSIRRPLNALSDTILTLRDGLGPDWSKTAVVAMTEFGRTVRQNGTAGTDHGTAGAMVLAGGALRGGQVSADWPGLAEVDLYDRVDLKPTRDVRAIAGWVLRDLLGLSASVIERDVFPGVELGANPGLIL